VPAAIRLQHYSIRTEQAYVSGIRRPVRFPGRRRPRAMHEREVEACPSHRAVNGRVAASTQSQALNDRVGLPAKGGARAAARRSRLGSRGEKATAAAGPADGARGAERPAASCTRGTMPSSVSGSRVRRRLWVDGHPPR